MEPLQSDIVTKEVQGKMRKSHISDDPIVKYINEHSLRLEPVQKKLIDVRRCLDVMLSSASHNHPFLCNICCGFLVFYDFVYVIKLLNVM